jgi:predicted acylesterase/phospholipase RssA
MASIGSEQLTGRAEPGHSPDSLPIALCLSGGGFRATFFHLGVVRVLRDLGLLSRITDVFSVSGGSILAGHLALNWEGFGMPRTN